MSIFRRDRHFKSSTPIYPIIIWIDGKKRESFERERETHTHREREQALDLSACYKLEEGSKKYFLTEKELEMHFPDSWLADPVSDTSCQSVANRDGRMKSWTVEYTHTHTHTHTHNHTHLSLINF